MEPTAFGSLPSYNGLAGPLDNPFEKAFDTLGLDKETLGNTVKMGLGIMVAIPAVIYLGPLVLQKAAMVIPKTVETIGEMRYRMNRGKMLSQGVPSPRVM